jgi:hypothetical protein
MTNPDDPKQALKKAPKKEEKMEEAQPVSAKEDLAAKFKAENDAEAARKREEKLAARKVHLKERLAKVLKRYEQVFGRSLTIADLKEYSAYCEKEETYRFLESKFLLLNGQDRELFAEILKDAK